MKKAILGITFLLAFSSIIVAQQKKDKLPGNPELPSTKKELTDLAALEKKTYKYSVDDYFQKPKQSSFKFSPNGLYLSYREKDEKSKNHVYVKNTETGKVSRVIEEGEDLVRGYGWANDSRLIYIKDKGGDENYHLFAVDLDGKNQIELTPFDGVRVGILSSLKDQKDYMIIQMNKDNPQIFEPYKINIKDGKYEKLYENKDPKNPIVSYDFDKDGKLKAYTQQQNGTEYALNYRTAEDKPFKKVIQTTWKDNFGIIGFDYRTKNPHDAFVRTNTESNTTEIILYDFAKKKTIEKVYSNKNYDVGGLSRSRKRNYEVDYYYYTGDKSIVVPVSKTYKKLHKKFTKKFKDQDFNIVSTTDKEDKFLLYITSDKLYGIYYLYDAKKDKFKELLNLMPALNPKEMSEMRPVKFKSRDGLIIHGYLTIPKNIKKGEKAPLIVNPHGGPYGVRDYWGFNPETQLFASRGYATLQVNYRGSGGYGKKFFLAENGSEAWVKLNYTSNYFDADQPEAIQNATITLSDNEGNFETLQHIEGDLYKGKQKASALRNYTLSVLVNEKTYSAKTYVHEPSEVLDFTFEENGTNRPFGGNSTNYTGKIYLKDDPNTENYYLLKFWIDNELQDNRYYLIQDQNYENTGVIEYTALRLNFEKGNKIKLVVYSIDESAYTYYSQLNDNDGGFSNSTPYNPQSNFGNEILGLFAGWSTCDYTTRVE